MDATPSASAFSLRKFLTFIYPSHFDRTFAFYLLHKGAGLLVLSEVTPARLDSYGYLT